VIKDFLEFFRRAEKGKNAPPALLGHFFEKVYKYNLIFSKY